MIDPMHLIPNANLDIEFILNRPRIDPNYRNRLREIWNQVISTSTPKVLIPDGGRILGGRFKGLDKKSRLPFDKIAIEYRAIGEPRNGQIVLAEQVDETKILVKSFHQVLPLPGDKSRNKLYHPNCYSVNVSTILENGYIKYERTVLHPENHDFLDLSTREYFQKQIYHSFSAVLELIEALSCSNVYLDTIPAPTKLNRNRVKQGKLPLYEYKILSLETPLESYRRKHQGGTHASPRQHLRRGHIRVYNRHMEDEYKIWINNMVIRKNDQHVIHKDYRVI